MTYLVHCPVGLVIMWRMVRLAVVWWVMRMIMVLVEIDNAVIERRALEPCVYIGTGLVNLAVDGLCLVSHLVVHVVRLVKGTVDCILRIFDDILGGVDNGPFILLDLDVLEDLWFGDDKGRC